MSWVVLGAAVRGTQHVTADLPCQDAFGVHVDGGAVVLCVSDGAGSRPEARAGARAAVDGVLAWARAGAPGGVAQAFGAARVSVRTQAAQDGKDADDYACTLTVATLGPDGWTVGQIGDGITVADGDDGPASVLVSAEREYVNETTFLTTPGSAPAVAAAPRGPLALSTDGLRMKVLADLRTGAPYRDFFTDVWGWAASGSATPEALGRFLEGLDDQTGDDKTLVVAVPAD